MRLMTLILLGCVGATSGMEITNSLDRIDTDIRYAKQLRDAGALGASIDVLGEAMQKMLLRIAEIQSRKPLVVTNVVTVTQECRHVITGSGYVVDQPVIRYFTNGIWCYQAYVFTNAGGGE